MAGGMRPRFLEPEARQQRGGIVTEPTVDGGKEPTGNLVITMDQLKELMAAAASGGQSLNAQDLAKAFAQTQKRENVHAPMVSVFNPRGETDHPRPPFVARKVTQNGVELNTDLLAWEEIEAINALPPGKWRVTKANGQKIPFKVEYVRGLDETTIERLGFSYPCKDENAGDHRPLFDYCVEVVEASDVPKANTLRELKRTLDKERAAAGLAA